MKREKLWTGFVRGAVPEEERGFFGPLLLTGSVGGFLQTQALCLFGTKPMDRTGGFD